MCQLISSGKRGGGVSGLLRDVGSHRSTHGVNVINKDTNMSDQLSMQKLVVMFRSANKVV